VFQQYTDTQPADAVQWLSDLTVFFIVIFLMHALAGLQAKYLPARGKPGCESCTSDALKQSLAKYQEKCGRSSKTDYYLGVVANLRQVCWKHHH